MTCISCGEKTFPSETTDVTELSGCLVIVRNVPCYKCAQCNEIIYTGDVVKRLEGIVKTAKSSMSEIAILDFGNQAA